MRHCSRRPKHQHDCSFDWNFIIAQPTIVIVKRYIIRVATILISVPAVVVSLQLPIIRNYKHFINQPLTVRHLSSQFQNNDDWPKQQPPHQPPQVDGNKDDQIDLDDDPFIDTHPTNLNHFVKEQMKKSQHNTFATNDVPDYYNHKQQQRYDPLMGYTLEDLESFASSSSSSLNRPKIPKYDTEELHTTANADGVYLDPNEYIKSSQIDNSIDIDGTIPFTDTEDIGATTVTSEASWTTSILSKISDARYMEAMQRYVESIVAEPTMNSISSDIDVHKYNIRESTTTSSTINNNMHYYQPQSLPVENPDSSYQRYDPIGPSRNTNNDMNDMASLDELWTAITQVQAQQRQHDPAVSEEIHRQIFANEIGFYNQSQLFLESLTNTTMGGIANAERHGEFFRARQEQAIQSLQQQIEEFEALLLSQRQKNATNDELLCTQCHCRLSDDEINNPASIGGINKEQICRVCYMERLVASSRRNVIDRIQPQYDSTRHATFRMNSQTGGIPINTRRYTTRKKGFDSEPTKQWSILDRTNSFSSRETINLERAKVSNEPYELSNTTNVNSSDGNINNDDSISYSTISLDKLQHLDLSEGSENVSDNNQKIIYPWVEVMDPDTEEIFYWNEETEEMRWEL